MISLKRPCVCFKNGVETGGDLSFLIERRNDQTGVHLLRSPNAVVRGTVGLNSSSPAAIAKRVAGRLQFGNTSKYSEACPKWRGDRVRMDTCLSYFRIQ